MTFLKFAVFAICIVFVQASGYKEYRDSVPAEEQLEDMEIANKTVEKYGMPVDPHTLQLPGPEFLKRSINATGNLFEGGPGNYTLRVRTIIFPLVSFNGRYEVGTVKKLNRTEISVVKGLFSEYFERKSGGFYIRTIGYTLDENGYKEFLLGLTKAFIPEVGTRIGSTVLGTLLGGNPIG